MSKAIKRSIIILIVLLVVSVGVALFSLYQKQSIEKENVRLSQQVAEVEAAELKQRSLTKKFQDKIQELEEQIVQKERASDQLQNEFDQVQKDLQRVSAQIAEANQSRDQVQQQLETSRREMNKLLKELDERPVKEVEKIVYRDNPADAGNSVEAVPNRSLPLPNAVENKDRQNSGTSSSENEEYWATLLKEKAALEIQIDRLQKELDVGVLQIVELKKENSDFKLELSKISNESEIATREIQNKEDLVHNLSVELARSKNEQRFMDEQVKKLGSENQTLRDQIKKLTSNKVALEKSLVRLGEEKQTVEKKLAETEYIIQGRIDEIWRLKDQLDTHYKNEAVKIDSHTKEVELAPIVVSTGIEAMKNSISEQQSKYTLEQESRSSGGARNLDGTVVSINNDNNFVILDLGEKSGVQLGEQLDVYRGKKKIAAIEVIQIRKDISAADIRQKSAELKVGDTVRTY